MMTPKVLILTNSLTGIYSFRKEVVQAIIEDGYSITICCPSLNHKAVDFFIQLGCDIRFVDIEKRGTNPISDLLLIKRYKKIISDIKPIVVLTYSIKPNIYGGIASRLCKVPHLANITGLGDAIENPGLLQTITITLYRFGLKKTRTVFCQNQTIYEFCRHNRIGTKLFLLPGSGVNTSQHVYQSYPQEDETIKFIYMGRFMKDKGTDELIDTIRGIKEKYSNKVEFVLLGSRYPENDFSYENNITELQQQGILKWCGVASDVRQYLKDAWCSILPSYHEGMSNVNLESAANGRPVITTNVPGCKETVDDGLTGYLVEAKSSKSLQDAVERFINLPYDQKVLMGQNARKKIEQEFDRQIVVKAYLEEIKRVNNV